MYYYYKGEMISLLKNIYNLLESIGYEVRWTNHDHSFVCEEFKKEGQYGTGAWSYSIGYDYCDDVKSFKDTIRIERVGNDNGKNMCSHIYKYDGENIFWANRLFFQESEWLECLLCGMIPSRAYSDILNKFSIEDDKSERKLTDISEYKRVSRDIKLSLMLND